MPFAAGTTFAAVATSANLLRLFTLTGIPTFVMTLPGAPVALTADGQMLAAVWHSGSPSMDSDSQNLAFSVYDADNQHCEASGQLLLSPKAKLTWLGFTKEGFLAAADSAGIIRVSCRH